MIEPLIRIEDLHYSYPGGDEAVSSIDLDIGRGEIIAIVGQNGAGKTTLAKHFNGLLKPTRGRVVVGNVDTRKAAVAALARKIGYVFQNPDHQIFLDTVAGEVRFGPSNLGLSPGEVQRRVDQALEVVGLSTLLGADPRSLSKGQRQRVALASVLSMEPEVLVLDEPTTGQDYREGKEIMDFVRDLNRRGHTVVFITHDMNLVARYADRVVVLCEGRVLMDGSPREVFGHPETLAKTHLVPPAATALALRLRNLGFGHVLTIEELMGECISLLGGDRKVVCL